MSRKLAAIKASDLVSRYSFSTWYSNEDDCYLAKCLEVGTVTHGNSPEKAIKEGRISASLVVEEILSCKQQPPEPFGDMDYSGKFVLRMTKEKHRDLAQNAAMQGVSLNHYIVGKL